METEKFNYHLPRKLIARYPLERGTERLLVVERHTGRIRHLQFQDILSYLHPGDVLVMNDTKVIPARLMGRKETGGSVEVLLLKRIEGARWRCLASASKRTRPGALISFGEKLTAVVEQKEGNEFVLDFSDEARVLTEGRVPLPPYIDREPEDLDREAYQTIYARHDGSIASPTAGLHFTRDMLGRISSSGIELVYVTLHVGPGTFTPVRTASVEEHTMHDEEFFVSDEAAKAVQTAIAQKRRIVAVGTTTTRVLEHLLRSRGKVVPGRGSTDIFIYDGFDFRAVDVLLTNFHLPCSTLLMLVSAFAGHELVMKAYHEAVEQRYRFFSYGDAMLII